MSPNHRLPDTEDMKHVEKLHRMCLEFESTTGSAFLTYLMLGHPFPDGTCLLDSQVQGHVFLQTQQVEYPTSFLQGCHAGLCMVLQISQLDSSDILHKLM